MYTHHLMLIAAVALTVAACQNESAPPVSNQGVGTAATATVDAKSSPVISVDPATLKSCDNVVASVKWDATKGGSTADSTEIWTGPSSSDTKLFAAGGATGEAKTGPWSHPGTHFILKDKKDGKVLGEAVIGGPTCH